MNESRLGPRQAAAGNRLMRAVRTAVRARNTEPTYGSLFSTPDLVENDYYRFIKQPRD